MECQALSAVRGQGSAAESIYLELCGLPVSGISQGQGRGASHSPESVRPEEVLTRRNLFHEVSNRKKQRCHRPCSRGCVGHLLLKGALLGPKSNPLLGQRDLGQLSVATLCGLSFLHCN